MKKLIALSMELLGYVAAGLLAGRYLDSAFGLKGWATLTAVFAAYALWMLQVFKLRSHDFSKPDSSPPPDSSGAGQPKAQMAKKPAAKDSKKPRRGQA